MVKKLQGIISSFIADHRLALWVLLLVLSSTILIFPVHLGYDYQSLQSTAIFGNKLPFFVLLYYIWTGVLFCLLFSSRKNNDWQRLALVCLFALVFFGFWTIITPNGQYADSIYNMAHIKYINETGHILLGQPNLGYFTYPILHLLGSAISQITGLTIFATVTLMMLLDTILLAALIFIIFSRTFQGDMRVASLGAILVILGNFELSVSQIFWPGNLGFIFLLAVIFLYNKINQKYTKSTADKLLIIICFITLVMTYLPAGFVFAFIMIGIYLVQKVTKDNHANLSIIILYGVMLLGWAIYWAASNFGSVISYATSLVQETRNGEVFSQLFAAQTSVNMGTVGVPLWANVTQYFWLAFIFVLGSLLGIKNLITMKRLAVVEKTDTGALFGIMIFGTIAVFLSPGGGQFGRFFMYAAFFTVPLLLTFLFKSKSFYKVVSAAMVILLLTLSLPTFLTNHKTVSARAIYPWDISAGEYLESSINPKSTLWAFTQDICVLDYYLPDANYVTQSQYIFSIKELWAQTKHMTDSFENYYTGTTNLFVLSQRFFMVQYQLSFGINSSDPNWLDFLHTLDQNNIVYENGYITIYEK